MLYNFRRRKWVFPTLIQSSEETEQTYGNREMKITGLSPYWFDAAEGSAVLNTVDMKSMFLLTGPNGGGKSSLLRSICAAALLGVCGFMIEMSEMRSIITRATSKSLVLVDEICRGTETAKGTCIAGSIIETLDSIGCLGVISTHLHDIFNLPLTTKNTVYKAMGSDYINGKTKPTWKLIDGICKESLAFETAQKEGVPEAIIQRAEELYNSVHTKDLNSKYVNTKVQPLPSKESESDKSCNQQNGIQEGGISCINEAANQMEKFRKDVENAVWIVCNGKLIGAVRCVVIAPREQPPPSTIGSSSVYVILRPDKKLYVGETDDLQGRVRAHRSKQGMRNASFLYFLVPGKSMACQLETLLINQLPNHGFRLANIADGQHRNFATSDISMESLNQQSHR